MRVLLLQAAVFWAGLGVASAVQSADIAPGVPEAKVIESESGWTYTAAPYFWAAGLSGDIAQFGLPEVHIDSSVDDILENLDFAFMAAGEARYERFSIFADVMYTKLGADANTRNGILADSVDVTSKTFAGLLGAGYSVLENPSGHLDIVAGVRVWSVDTTIGFNGGLLGGREADDGATWVDALAGVRGNYFFTPEIYVTGWGLVGGGGADLDWDVSLALGYRFTDTISAVAGYRAVGVNYNNDGFVFDVVEQGPIIGVAFRF
ncbi:hypothetical protein EV130_111192 [Rhizobium azibense]|uniref:Outer membrane protein n=1 Tax=Rhizobium azibense TaxID=1136135 RepID=A0A4V6P0Y7_9HYPH|nr:hypothetical protein [Rhizobium azibense]TCU21335.1 hypothetical protein EV130_111192 [Rhizobium azibense]